jgi:hypothetical protein
MFTLPRRKLNLTPTRLRLYTQVIVFGVVLTGCCWGLALSTRHRGIVIPLWQAFLFAAIFIGALIGAVFEAHERQAVIRVSRSGLHVDDQSFSWEEVSEIRVWWDGAGSRFTITRNHIDTFTVAFPVSSVSLRRLRRLLERGAPGRVIVDDDLAAAPRFRAGYTLRGTASSAEAGPG